MKKSLILAPLILTISGCDTETQSGAFCPEPPATSYSDVEGDTAFTFMDVKSVSVAANNCQVKITLDLLSAPTNLSINGESVGDNNEEYSWSVYFDVDRDGALNKNVSLSAAHAKVPGSIPGKGSFPNFTSNSVGVYYGSGGSHSSTRFAPIQASLNGTKLTLSVSKNRFGNSVEGLWNINSETPFRVVTRYNFDGSTYSDRYPDNGYFNKSE